MKRVKTIVLDVDGVLLNFTQACDDYVKKYLNKEPVQLFDNFNLSVTNMVRRYGFEKDSEVLTLLDEMVANGFYKNIPAFEGIKESVQKIKEKNFKIVVVTAVHDGAKEDRLINLLNEVNLIPDEIYCVGMGKSKSEILAEIMPDIFVDDRMKYLKGGTKIFHSVWVDQEESQEGDETLVNVHVKSLNEWVERYMEEVSEILDEHYDGAHLQMPLKLESVERKYKDNSSRMTKDEYQNLLKASTPRMR